MATSAAAASAFFFAVRSATARKFAPVSSQLSVYTGGLAHGKDGAALGLAVVHEPQFLGVGLGQVVEVKAVVRKLHAAGTVA